MGFIQVKDGSHIYYKDWGQGQPVVFCHGWPLNSDSWEAQMMFLVKHGFRCVAHDRRGHGRSDQSSNGNNMDTYADDLAVLIDGLDLNQVVLVGFSAGGGEVARYIGRHGTARIAKAILISAVPPHLVKSKSNPEGIEIEKYNQNREASISNRAQLYKEIANGPFFGANRVGSNVSQGTIDSFWQQGMQAGLKNTYECIEAFSETDFTQDLMQFDMPTLIVHGDDDQVVPLEVSFARSAKLIKHAVLKVYSGAPHGLTYTHQAQVNADLLEFINS